MKEGDNLTKAEKLDMILSAIGSEWVTYRRIYERLDKKIGVAGISKLIWGNAEKIKDQIEWEVEHFGPKVFQQRMRFRKRI